MRISIFKNIFNRKNNSKKSSTEKKIIKNCLNCKFLLDYGLWDYSCSKHHRNLDFPEKFTCYNFTQKMKKTMDDLDFTSELFPPSYEELVEIIKKLQKMLENPIYEEEWEFLNKEFLFRKTQLEDLGYRITEI